MVYVIYRVLVAIYFFGWIIHTGTGNRRYATSEAERVKWFLYLTNWTNFMLTTCVMIQGVIAIFCYVKFTRRNDGNVFFKLNYDIFNISIEVKLGLRAILAYMGINCMHEILWLEKG